MVQRVPAAIVLATVSLVWGEPARAQQDAAVVAAVAAVTAVTASVTTPVAAAATITPPALAPSLLALERSHARFTDQVRASHAYARGLSGRGVTIAVLDTGIDAMHREFASAGKLASGFNAATGSQDVTDANGHGTHVAGLLAANRDARGMHGIAFDATLLPIKVFADNGASNSTYVERGLRHAIGKAAIANLSLGSVTASNPAAIRDAVRSGMLLVAAAGNGSGAHPQWPARYAKEAWANHQIIAVGAVDEKNRIAAFSNRAGDAAAWFLVAPGINLVSTSAGGAHAADVADATYAAMSGTSMAVPIVSGAAALIRQQWPYLRADQVATILFITATDLGEPGIDATYGRGLLDIEKALQPVGNVTTRAWGGAIIKLLDTSLAPSPATSKFWSLAAAGALDAVGTDAFHRGYRLNMATSVARAPGLTLEHVFGDLERRSEIAERVFADGARLRYLPPGSGLARQAGSFAYVSGPAQRAGYALGNDGMASRYFGIAGAPLLHAAGAAPVLANPYFSLLPGAAHLALAGQPDGRTSLRLGWLKAGMTPALDPPLGQRPPAGGAPHDSAMRRRAEMALVELLHGGEAGALSLSLSRTVEQEAFLAAQSHGSFGFGPQATTTAVQLGAAWRFAPRCVVAGQAAFGVTPGSVERRSLISEMSALRTNAFSIALVAADRFIAGDRLSLSLAQPLRAYAGTITLDAVTAIDDDGRELREQRTLAMAPAAREVMMELNYQRPAGRAARLALVLSLRRHPNHLDDAATEKLLAMRLVRQF